MRESEIDAHNQSTIDLSALTAGDDLSVLFRTDRSTITNFPFTPASESAFLPKVAISRN